MREKQYKDLHLFVGNCGSAGVSGHWTGEKIIFAVGNSAVFTSTLLVLTFLPMNFFDGDQDYYLNHWHLISLLIGKIRTKKYHF